MLNSVLGSFSSGVAASTSSYESIATATGTGSSGTITFSSIASTYKHLQIRINGIITSPSNCLRVRFNGDTASNYPYHQLITTSNGASMLVSSVGSSATTAMPIFPTSAAMTSTYPDVAIIDVIDYASSTKNKTLKAFSGSSDNDTIGNTYDSVNLVSGLWLNTAAITSITVFLDSGSFATTASLALYGIRG